MSKERTLREEIERRLASNQVYYAHFVSDGEPMKKIREDTANDILKIFQKNIDKRANRFLEIYSIDDINLDLLEGRKLDEIPSQIAYLKALIDMKRTLEQ